MDGQRGNAWKYFPPVVARVDSLNNLVELGVARLASPAIERGLQNCERAELGLGIKSLSRSRGDHLLDVGELDVEDRLEQELEGPVEHDEDGFRPASVPGAVKVIDCNDERAHGFTVPRLCLLPHGIAPFHFNKFNTFLARATVDYALTSPQITTE